MPKKILQKANFIKWVEVCECPFCGNNSFTNEEHFEATEIFRDYTCDKCEKEWTERYNLSLVFAKDEEDHVVSSELEDRLTVENMYLKDFIKSLHFNDVQIAMICDGKKDVRLDSRCLSLIVNGINKFEPRKYEKNDSLEAFFLVKDDLVKVNVSSLNEVSVLLMSEKTTNPDTLEFIDVMHECNTRAFILDKYQEEKYPFLYDGEIDMDKLSIWSASKENVELINLFVNDKYTIVAINKGDIVTKEYESILDLDLNAPKEVDNAETKEYKYFWVDPAFKDGPDLYSSGLCEIVDFPLLSMSFKCYAYLEYEDYQHCNDEGRFGLETGDFNIHGEYFESHENIWFETEAKREEYVNTLGIPSNVDIAKPEFFNNPDVYMDLRNYPSDTIFNIKLENGSDAEVYQNELFQLIKIDTKEEMPLFVRFETDNEGIKIIYSPKLKDGTMSPSSTDYEYADESNRCMPINQLATYCFLETNYTSGVSFDYKGNDEIEGFYANIVSFQIDTDKTVFATIIDMNDNHFDVSWNEIKDSDFNV